MNQFTYTIKDEVGLHARPAGMLAKLAKSFDGAVTITKGDKTVDAAKLMAVMGLGIKHGDEIIVSSDDETALAEIKKFLEENL